MRHVLVAEDDPVVLSMVSRALQSRGHAVHFAYDVVQAVQTVHRARLDLAVLDIAMPGGTGFDVIRRMKMRNRTGPIPIIVISARMDAGLARKARQMGADATFAKPLDLDRFTEACENLLAGRRDDEAVVGRPLERLEAVYFGA